MKFLWRAKTAWLWYELDKRGIFPANTPLEAANPDAERC